jgi:DtxR family Mn-dependent transcriptional regulator
MSESAAKTTKLTESMEDYLEAIAIVKGREGVARVRDITKMLDVEAPSVTSALANLSKKGYVVHERYGYVDLTSKGERAAKDVIKRHEVLFDFLTEVLGVGPKVALKDACGMEHSLSGDTMRRLTKLLDLVRKCPDEEKPDWLAGFERYRRTGKLGSIGGKKRRK